MITEEERISKIIAHFCKSKAEFARSMDESPQVVSNWVSRGAGKVVLNKILSKYPDINANWLLTGEGEMLSTVNDNATKSSKTTTEADEDIPSSDYRLVPLINLDAVGGMQTGNDSIDEQEYVIGRIAFSGAQEGDKCLRITGHSMEPACPPGSVVLIREVERWYDYFGFGNIFVVLLDDGRRVLKQITKSEEDPKKYVRCVSFNKEYPEEDLPKSMIAGVWKVIKVLTDRGW